jgi:hypothetical protein
VSLDLAIEDEIERNSSDKPRFEAKITDDNTQTTVGDSVDSELSMISKVGARMLSKVIGMEHSDLLQQLTLEEAKKLLYLIEEERSKNRSVKANPRIHENLMTKLELALEGLSDAQVAERTSSTRAAISVTRVHWVKKATESTRGKLPDINELLERIGAIKRLGGFANSASSLSVSRSESSAVNTKETSDMSIEELINNVVDKIIHKLGYDSIPRERVLEVVNNTITNKVYGEAELSLVDMLKNELQVRAESYEGQDASLGLTKKEWQLLSTVSGFRGARPSPLYHRSRIQGAGNGQSGEQIVQTTFLSGVAKLLSNGHKEPAKFSESSQDFLV